jgi:hypothetical protein
MEFLAPIAALAGLYVVSNQDKKNNMETFSERTGRYENRGLPNIDVPDRNYPSEEYPPQSDLTSQLSTVNKYSGNTSYTDKYFNPNDPTSLLGKSNTQNSQMFSNSVPNPETSKYTSLTGEKVDADYFQHQNMQPFFGSHLRTIRTDANVVESRMDNYTGAGSQIRTKSERAPLFSPQENYQWAFGAPNMSDFYQSRVNSSNKMSNVKPFEEEHVGPGIGVGYGSEGFGGYNSGLMARDMYLDRGVDELRVANHLKPGGLSLYGHEGPANSSIKYQGSIGDMQKNRVDTSFEMGPERYMTTVGMGTAPTCRGIDVMKEQGREDSMSYSGVAGAANDATYVDGEYMPSKHIDLGEVPIAPAYKKSASSVSDTDYGNQSNTAYPNNRSANQQDTYFGAFGGAMGAVIAPLLDALRPSRRENTIGTLRPYQNPGSSISKTYMFNPEENRPATTLKESLESGSGHMFVDRNQSQGGTGYLVAGNQPITNNRMKQGDFLYVGPGSAMEGARQPRTYDAEYRQRNNDVKSSTLASYTPSGNMGLFNSEIHMTSKAKETHQKNNRAMDPTMPSQAPNVAFMGKQTGPTSFNTGIQLDRTQPDMLSQLKGNPFAISHLKGL